MANILSQHEIDELLNALSSGVDAVPVEEEVTPAKVRPYNFRTANKFPKEQFKTIHFIYENYSRRLSTYLSGTLRTMCEVDVASIEEQSFNEFNNSVPSPVILAIITMPPLQGPAIILVPSAIAYEMISRLFGGATQSHDIGKPFTEIETAILIRIIRQMLSHMGEAWEKVAKVTATLDRIETSSQFAQIVSPNEPIAIITLNVKIGQTSGMMNVCIPHVAIQPLAKQLVSKLLYSDGQTEKVNIHSDQISQRLSSTQVTLHAAFNDTYATVKDILNLQMGDVIRLDHSIKESLTVKVEHISKFRGIAGTHNTKYAVQITEILREETEDE